MPVIRHPSQFESHSESGWVSQAWAGAEVFGEPVPMTVRRHRLEPAASWREFDNLSVAYQEAGRLDETEGLRNRSEPGA